MLTRAEKIGAIAGVVIVTGALLYTARSVSKASQQAQTAMSPQDALQLAEQRQYDEENYIDAIAPNAILSVGGYPNTQVSPLSATDLTAAAGAVPNDTAAFNTALQSADQAVSSAMKSNSGPGMGMPNVW
ncbi:MAG: hypothetical protein KGH96_23460 [Sphingomonadales bacterium]|nr:hypothetical protein [Sphingomonadales bacterium]